MATEICERVRGSEATKLHRGPQSAYRLRADAEEQRIGFDEGIRQRQHNAWATDRLLELLIEHHEYSSGQIAQPAKIDPVPEPQQHREFAPRQCATRNPAPSDTASDGLALRPIAEPEACGAPPWPAAITLNEIYDHPPPTLGFRLDPAITILRVAAKHFGVLEADLASVRRDQKSVNARHVIMFLMKEMTFRSLPDIGRRLGGRDHTTVIHGINRIARLIAEGDPLAAEVNAVRALALAAGARSTVLS